MPLDSENSLPAALLIVPKLQPSCVGNWPIVLQKSVEDR